MYQMILPLIMLFAVSTMSAQITIDSYPMKIRVDIEELDNVAPVTASSSCGAVEVEFDDMTFSGGCLGTLARTYTFTDDCGNVERAQQFITLEDATPPDFDNAPGDMTVEANSIPDAPEVTASDNSGKKVRISFEESRDDNRITRMWVARDQCGNTIEHTQVITITGL